MRPAGAAGLAEPPHEIDGRSAGGDDVPVGVLRGADGRVRRGAGVQRADPGAAAGVLRAVPDELGAVFAVWEVCRKAFFFSFRFGFSQLRGYFLAFVWMKRGERGKRYLFVCLFVCLRIEG